MRVIAHRATIRRHAAGFTFLELMCVLIIIAVVMSIAAIAYQMQKDRAYTKICLEQQRELATALEQYNGDHAPARTDYPAVIPELVANGYLSDLPQDPGGGVGSYVNYMEASNIYGISCSKHGAIE